MTTPPFYQFVNDDGHGNVFFPRSSSSSSDGLDSFNSAFDGFNSAVKWTTTASVVLGIVTTLAVVAIVYAIIDCLRRTGRAMPTYTGLSTSDSNQLSMSTPSKQSDVAISIHDNSKVEFATIEGFISNMVREKPIRFLPDQVSKFTEDYKTILGSGGFGVVFKGKLPNGILIAVKVLNNHLDKQLLEQQFMAEVGTIGRTYHINLVRLFGFCLAPNLKALVYEYMENGSLDKFLFREERELEWERLYDIAIGTAKGLSYLHEECEHRIIHYDIKPGNVLLDKDMKPKVGDFGLARLYDREKSRILLTDRRGTPGYAAPELWKPYPVTQKCDVYSFGMVLFEVVGRRRNFDDNVMIESRKWLPRWTWDMFRKGELVVMLSLCGTEDKDVEKAKRMLMVALWCIQYKPEERPSMSSVVKILEGDMEVSPPPYPFEQDRSIEGESDEDSNGSLSLERDDSESLKLLNGNHEIELVAC